MAHCSLPTGPSLKTLCKLAVIQYSLDQSCLPHDIRYCVPRREVSPWGPFWHPLGCAGLEGTVGAAPALGAVLGLPPSVSLAVLQMGALGHDDQQHHQPPHRLVPGLTPASASLPSLLHTVTSSSTACMSFFSPFKQGTCELSLSSPS